ncbi:glycoside hydrolase family 26 protein [Catellatospora citrea]|uniref:GH26 domain-containing protein n=1 Tax=Catellatospora citrea TaxID=53366 RepID=A0A8J3NZN5_9ACTN|nr:hypothetical protein [Catellatospora citrea]RKE08151.1 hypothetical protein C8E86_2995 [Catellatospora citrea]GIF98533.1 hypothetical protein Cci01nite_36270 [Catellatospora citrea]
MNRTRFGIAVTVTMSTLASAVLLGLVAGRLSAPPTRVTVSEDSYTMSTEPGVTAGSRLTLTAGGVGGGAAVSYLKFDVKLPTGRQPKKVWLWLGRHSGPLPRLVELTSVPDTRWREGTLTAATAPRLGNVVASVAPGRFDRAVAFDVTRVVRRSGRYAFAITAPSGTEAAQFVAGEAGTESTTTGPPTITFEWNEPASPTLPPPIDQPTIAPSPSGTPEPEPTVTPWPGTTFDPSATPVPSTAPAPSIPAGPVTDPSPVPTGTYATDPVYEPDPEPSLPDPSDAPVDPGLPGDPSPSTEPGPEPDPSTEPGQQPSPDPATEPSPDPDPATEPSADPGTEPGPGAEPSTGPEPGAEPSADPDPGSPPSPDPGTEPGPAPGPGPGPDPGPGQPDPGTPPGPEPSPGVPPVSEPTEPPVTDPSLPPVIDPELPPVTDPSAPPTTDPGQPPVTDPTEPPATDPSLPPGTDPSLPPVTDPSLPPVTDPSAPPTTEPSAPPSTDPSAGPTVPPASPSPSTDPNLPVDCVIGQALVPTCGALWGVAPGAHTSQNRIQALYEFERRTNRQQVVYHAYHRGTSLFPTADELSLVRDPAHKRVLFLNWKPQGVSWAGIARGDGRTEAYLDRLAVHIRGSLQDQFFFTMNHEPENDVNPRPGSGMTAQDYAAAFRHVVTGLRARGVSNLVSVMCYMAFVPWNVKSWFEELYPGDDVVDWVAWDTYAYSDPGYGYGDFAEMMNRKSGSRKDWPGFYNWAATSFPDKPLMLGEWGVWHSRSNPQHQARFFDSARLQLELFPRLKALVYFESPAAEEGRSSMIDMTTTGLSSFQQFSRHPAFDIVTGPAY